ncbi:hypothetical protein E1A91_D08G045700v1 [Gossypium mustelinum]|uniref:Pentacotripeptide-repeat region of PRORP domain-containing protein n=3 Tax=Gossypium TaxID=3633 RepID=A0A5J5QB83_GOSBA|nr:hypothetical protein ES319_D08G043800v1 [Gossypium barbadense]TYG56246.1 hypothetical protein ES288_D08G048600v1 [Gossypium darwinii]TYI67823.1 hypothetical protein E1A91_D08G045700v1 [Gossypium mustelinum]
MWFSLCVSFIGCGRNTSFLRTLTRISERNFFHQTNFEPKPGSLERYLRCLCENKSVEEGVDVFSILTEIGYCPSIETNDLMWKLYQDMVEPGVGVDIDVGAVGCLIQAFCIYGKVSKG